MRRAPLIALLTVLLSALLVVPAGPASAAAPAVHVAQGAQPAERGRAGGGVVSREVVFNLSNSTVGTRPPCVADNRFHRVRARLVGPRRAVRGKAGVIRVNVLVHDAGTGGWFWHLGQRRSLDYAAQLARRGETSLVLDRLGYDRSPLRNGRDTCLGAQVHMLHQVVQHLYAGKYAPVTGGGERSLPHAGHVVVHGHGTGAVIAQLEAAEHRDTAGLVLMSYPGATPAREAVSQVADQVLECLRRDYAPFGGSAAGYRSLLFADAAPGVARLATRLRNATPCGDVLSTAAAVVATAATTSKVDVPVLVLSGSKDRRARPVTAARARTAFSGAPRVLARILRGAGSALPLERTAGTTRRHVLGFLRTLPPR